MRNSILQWFRRITHGDLGAHHAHSDFPNESQFVEIPIYQPAPVQAEPTDDAKGFRLIKGDK